MADRQFRVVMHHDTWVSIDPVRGCPYSCAYCVLRHAGTTGVRPEQMVSPKECVNTLLAYPFFHRGITDLAIGNETDMFHKLNVGYLISLLDELNANGINNRIALITKAPLDDEVLMRIRTIAGLRVIFFLSYSGLPQHFEPNFSQEQLQENFHLAKKHGFPVIHFWRPLMAENTTVQAIQRMLGFVSAIADASVFVGLKLNPELNRVLSEGGVVQIPSELNGEYGEWLSGDVIERIYGIANDLCPDYPLYRHTSCALACVSRWANRTGTAFRADICPQSHCPAAQRRVCEAALKIPAHNVILAALKKLGRDIEYCRHQDRVTIVSDLTQEEFSFLLSCLKCPIQAARVRMQGVYRGDIFEGQKFVI